MTFKKNTVNSVCVVMRLPHPSSPRCLTYFSFILLSTRSFVWIRWPLRWRVSVLCTEGLALSPVYIRLYSRASLPGLGLLSSFVGLKAGVLCSHSRSLSVARAGQHMAAAANSLHRGAQSSEQGLLLFRPLLLLCVMTFVGRRIGVEGLVYPRGERGRQKRGSEGEGWKEGGEAKTCRQTGVWIMEI